MKLSQKFLMPILLCLILLSVNFVYSQTKQDEKRLSDTNSGYSFAVPVGFDSKQNEVGFGLVNTEKTIIIAIKNHDFNSFEEFSAQSNLEKDGFSLAGRVFFLNLVRFTRKIQFIS